MIELFDSKACTWFPIYLLLTFFLHIVPFIWYLIWRVWLWPLTFRSHMRSKYFCHLKARSSLPIWLLLTFALIEFLRYLARTVFEIFDFEVFRVWPWPLIFGGHLGSKIFSPFGSPYRTSYLTSIDIFSLSRAVLEIFDFLSFQGLTLTFDLQR